VIERANEKKLLTVAVDGPAGTGKSTVCKLFAKKEGLTYLDTGALYRTVALRFIETEISYDDSAGIDALLAGTKIGIKKNPDRMTVFLNGKDVTDSIREEGVGMIASKISAIPRVRQHLLFIQREAAKEGGIIAEGRDMGTVVFPDADIKIYLDADPAERARRRYCELESRGERVDYSKVMEDLEIRDMQDRSRAAAPLKPSDDAIVIDTTRLGIDDVVQTIQNIANRMKCRQHRNDRPE
jgi:cytidylate kinase